MHCHGPLCVATICIVRNENKAPVNRELGLRQKKPMFPITDQQWTSVLFNRRFNSRLPLKCWWYRKRQQVCLTRLILYRYWMLQWTVSFPTTKCFCWMLSRERDVHASIHYEIASNTSGLKPCRCPKGVSAWSCVRDLSLQCISICMPSGPSVFSKCLWLSHVKRLYNLNSFDMFRSCFVQQRLSHSKPPSSQYRRCC